MEMIWGHVDTVSSVMEAPGDKMATTHAEPPIKVPYPSAPRRGKHGKPAAMVKFGSASVPVYRCVSGGRVRFAISHYRDGKRLRQFFTTLEAAKKEALFVAQRIQSGMTAARTAPKGKGIDIIEVALATGETIGMLSKAMLEYSSATGLGFIARDAANILQAEAIVLGGGDDFAALLRACLVTLHHHLIMDGGNDAGGLRQRSHPLRQK